MTQAKQGARALGTQMKLYGRLPRSKSFDPAPGKDNLLLRNDLEIGPFNPQTAEVPEAKNPPGPRIGRYALRQPSQHLPSFSQKRE
jgi:hypothetical protein